jgi:hypothetical protein
VADSTTNPNQQAYPGLGHFSTAGQKTAIRTLWDRIHQIEGRPQSTGATFRQNPNMAGLKVTNAADPTSAQDYATKNYVDTHTTGAVTTITKTIIESGSSSGGGSGVAVITDTHAVRLSTTPSSGVLFYETDRGALYAMTGAAVMWTLIGQLTPLAGTLPIGALGLGGNDTNFEYYSTDYDRLYLWNGSNWVDAPGEPTRHMIAYFDITSAPTGWAICNGVAGNISKSDGTTTAYTPPSLTGTNKFIRSNTTVAGTGGATTDTETTGNDSGGGTAVQSGAGTTVATHTHTHSVTVNTVPPYYDLVPMVRL